MSLCWAISEAALCFPGFLRIPSTSSALLTLFCCCLFTGSQMDPALHPYLAPSHLYWEFWLAYPGSGLQILSVARASVSCSCSSAFSSTDREPIFPLMWRDSKHISRTFTPLSVRLQPCGTVRTLERRELCVSISMRVALSPPPADIPEARILWAAGCLGTVTAGIWLGATVPLHHPHLERLMEKSDGHTYFKIKSSALYIYNVNIIYFPLCCILWEFYP